MRWPRHWFPSPTDGLCVSLLLGVQAEASLLFPPKGLLGGQGLAGAHVDVFAELYYLPSNTRTDPQALTHTTATHSHALARPLGSTQAGPEVEWF